MSQTDHHNHDFTALKQKKVFLLDMDGTLYNEERLFEGVIPFLARLKDLGIRYFFLTNNSSKSASDYLAKLNRLGIKAELEEVIISSHIAAHYVLTKYGQAKTYVVGTASLIGELRAKGVAAVTEITPDVKVVLVGNDTELTFDKLQKASYLLTKGAAFVATNVDRACPAAFGFVPDCGGICRMLTYATGRKPRYVGKPNREIVAYVHALTNADKNDIVMVGDRLYTDMAMAAKYGMTSVCVLSGEATPDTIKKFKYQIDYVVKDVAALLAALR